MIKFKIFKKKPRLLHGRAASYDIIRFNKPKRKIAYECWERNVDMFAENSHPFDGWPFTFTQMDNYRIKEGFKLPHIKTSKPNQVVTVMNNYTSEVISSLRMNGSEYQPTV